MLMTLAVACQKENEVVVTGTWQEGAGEQLTLGKLNVSRVEPLDSVTVKKNGTFKMKFPLESPEIILLTNQAGKRITLLPAPGERVELELGKGPFHTQYTVTGSEESRKVQSLILQLEDTRHRLDSLEKAMEAVQQEEGNPTMEVLRDAYVQTLRQQKRASIRFIVENLNAPSSIYALYQRLGPERFVMDETRDLQYMKIVADSLKNKYPGSTLVQSLVEDAGRREAQYNNLKFLSQLSEDQVSEAGSVNLVLPDPSGRPVSLESLEGKVVLVNFWASYNQESIRMNENLKNVYRKYQSEGFEVYNISLDADPASWRKAIRFEEYPWIDVRDPDGEIGRAHV